MIVKCLNCAVALNKRLSDIKKFPNNFCSRSCNVSYQNRLNPKRLPQGECRQCSRPCSTRRVFCRSECKETYKLEKPSQSKTSYEKVRSWRHRTKGRAVEYMGGECLICGYNRCLRALSFHHLDPRKKDFRISARCASWESIVQELNKCILLCSNCHMEVHDGFLVIGAGGVEPPTFRLSTECSGQP